MSQLIPEPRPSLDCGKCEEPGICPCACHLVGNYFRGYHYTFNYIPDEMLVKPEKHIENWGN